MAPRHAAARGPARNPLTAREGPRLIALLATSLAIFVSAPATVRAADEVGTFNKVLLDGNTFNPMELDVAPDGRVFFIERGGDVKIYKPSSGTTVVAGHVDVFTGNEDGLLGLALSPSFSSNHWLYLYYSPAGTEARQVLGRFTVQGDSLVADSKKVLLRIRTQRQLCCHSAGSLAFGPDGNLYISTGDNTFPFESGGYTPIDERPGRAAYDAQRTAGNADDLRGDILRIRPTASGTYTIPPGNLFPSDGSKGRPEIYAMGNRNPFRMSIDPATGTLYWGDVGPDALTDSVARGPRGYDELNRTRKPGYFGWPYCIANNKPYVDYNFATDESGPLFDCAAPRNNSPNNTGRRSLPPARKAVIWYPHGDSPPFGTGGSTIMAGPVYRFNADSSSARKFPAALDGALFLYDWSRTWIKLIRFDDGGAVASVKDFMPDTVFRRPIDMDFGQDGALYLLEWGTSWSDNSDSGLYRIDFTRESLPPVARASVTPDSGTVPLTVRFSSAGSFDPSGEPISYSWDFTSDGTPDSTARAPAFTYETAGNFTTTLIVTNASGKTAVASVPVSAGNTRPTVRIVAPVKGGFFAFGTRIAFRISVTDPEDGEIDCGRVVVQPLLGHGSHAHPLAQTSGCKGIFRTVLTPEHDRGSDKLFYIVTASYTDQGAPGVQPLTGRAHTLIQPKRKQAEFFTRARRVRVRTTADDAGYRDVVLGNRSWLSFKPANLLNIDALTYRIAARGAGTVEVRLKSPSGPIISRAAVSRTGFRHYVNVVVPAPGLRGTHELFFVFRSHSERARLRLNWIHFGGRGVGLTAA